MLMSTQHFYTTVTIQECITTGKYNKENSAEYYVAPAFHLHPKNLMKASVWYIFGKNRESIR